MATDESRPQPRPLIPVHTLTWPSGTTRAWSSRPHPSARSPLLATASSDRTVQVWDLRDYKLVSTITGGHKRSIRCVGWKDWGHPPPTQSVSSAAAEQSSDPANAESTLKKPVTLATGSFDANVGIWIHDPSSANKSRAGALLDLDHGDEMDMTRAADALDGSGAGGDENEEEDQEEWHFTTLLTGPDSEIKDLQFSPAHYGANLLATCSRDKSVWVWEEVEDDNEWETVAVLSEHTGDVKCVGWCAGASVVIDGEPEIVGGREILATGSYDDTIRLWRDVEEEGDWDCVAVVEGHKGTVWDLCWEGHVNSVTNLLDADHIREWEPRLISGSDDMSVKVWKRQLSEHEQEKKRERLANGSGLEGKKQKLPSSIRPSGTRETWVEETTLPQVHVRSVYAVDWSRTSGLVVSCGGDGTIAVYKETADVDGDTGTDGPDVVMQGTGLDSSRPSTKWTVVAVAEAAHDEYEVNHVCWAARRDKGKRVDGEQVIVSTGDDGDVKIWCLPEELL